MAEVLPQHPMTLIVSAIGGEGGGVLANWIVAAARHADLDVQSTSIPGVAQRTGATVYYLEIYPVPLAQLGGRRPVLAIYPGVGDVDVMIASEFAEAGRAIANGFITPDRTTLIASTHRVYAVDEKIDPSDGRMDDETVLAAIRDRAARALLGDLRALAEENQVSLNAILLGVFAAANFVPIPRASFEAAIRETGVATEPNLKGFDIGFSHRFGDASGALAGQAPDVKRHARKGPAALEARVGEILPGPASEAAMEGVRRLAGYQGDSYAALFLDRLETVARAEIAAGGNGAVTREASRHLAVRMSYEDIIRVAQLKTDPARMDRIREEVQAAPGEPVTVYEYFKPGVEEFCDILPAPLGRTLSRAAAGKGWARKAKLGLRLRSTTVTGFLLLRLLASLRCSRPVSFGYRRRQESIKGYLSDIRAACALSLDFAFEVAACGGLEKGYGGTAQRTAAKADDLRASIIKPVLDGRMVPALGADALANARAAAARDPDGAQLREVLEKVAAAS